MVEAGLTRQSPEIQDWIEKVKELYMEVIERAVKYLTPSLKSKTLQYLNITGPKFITAASLDELKMRYRYVAQKFSNIISVVEIPELLEQVTLMKAQKSLVELADTSPEKFFKLLSNVKNGKYSKLVRLGQALLCMYSSSSEVERDFRSQVGTLF